MFKFFKKKNVEKFVKLETIFPTAKDVLKATSEHWDTKTNKEILKGIKKKMARGERYVYFFNSHISEQTIKELRHQGYYVEVSSFDNTPYFQVSW